jgi:hypothetical protein
MGTSQKRITANRLNGKKGGVKTAIGKSTSCRNARKHDLFSKSPIIRIVLYEECEEEYRERLVQAEIDHPGDEFELVECRNDLAWVDLMISRLRQCHKATVESRIKQKELGLVNQLRDNEKSMNDIRIHLDICRDNLEELQGWAPEFSEAVIPPKDLETCMSNARRLFDDFKKGLFTAEKSNTALLEALESLPDPNVAPFKDIAPIYLNIEKLLKDMLQETLEVFEEEHQELLLQRDALVLELILPENEQLRFLEYETTLQRHRDRTLARINFIEQNRLLKMKVRPTNAKMLDKPVETNEKPQTADGLARE